MPTQDREVYITADTLMTLMREYVGKEVIPTDAYVHQVNVGHDGIPGMLGLRIASGSYSGLEAPELVEFKLGRS